jgi:predicted nuclease of restriction endonuclease-like (RecB) superfamily
MSKMDALLLFFQDMARTPPFALGENTKRGGWEDHQEHPTRRNSSLIELYWNMGKMIADNQALFQGRNNYVEQLVKDLRAEFPDMKGFSRSNLFYIRKFYQFYATISVQQVVGLNETSPDIISMQQPVALENESTVQQPVGFNLNILSVPWGHHLVLLDKAKSVDEALFYLQQTIENNWSRAILTLQNTKFVTISLKKDVTLDRFFHLIALGRVYGRPRNAKSINAQ